MEARSKYFENDGQTTRSSQDQKNVEDMLSKYYYSYRIGQKRLFDSLKLTKQEHIDFLMAALERLSTSYQSLDASRPWLCYWILHPLSLLGVEIDENLAKRVIDFLSKCQNKSGGFAGGPGQLSHLAPTYAAINSLVILGTKEAYDIVDRKALLEFYISLKKEGGFQMHQDGEIDVRGCYTVMSISKMLNIMTPELLEGVGEHIGRCQTYEGGIGAYPGNEAHGGYAFCGLAALMLMDQVHHLDVDAFMYWAARRQMAFEGGFQGRTHKLVDSCYSFWMGGCFPLIQACKYGQMTQISSDDAKVFDFVEYYPTSVQIVEIVKEDKIKIEIEGEKPNNFPMIDGEWFFDQNGLQEYLLLCCQKENGGMCDKPGKSRDYYHSCYALSGLSIAQNNPSGEKSVLGNQENLLRETSPMFNIVREKVQQVKDYFK